MINLNQTEHQTNTMANVTSKWLWCACGANKVRTAVVSDIPIFDFRHFRHHLGHLQHRLRHFRHPQKGFQKSPTSPTSPQRTSDISDKLPTRGQLLPKSHEISDIVADILKYKISFILATITTAWRESLLVYLITHNLKMWESNHVS